MEPALNISLDMAAIEAFCQKWHIIEFSLFGSVLREDFGPDSDVDVLVTYDSQYKLRLDDIFDAEEELSGLLKRRVELVDRQAVLESHNYIRRRRILGSARQVYAS
jgi:predicted nucleotidyltransferase